MYWSVRLKALVGLVTVLIYLFQAQSIRVHFLAPCWWWAAGPLVHWSTGPLLLGKVAWKADGHPSIRTGFRLLAPAAQLPHRRALRVESGNCPACCPVHGSSAFIMPA